MASVLEERNVKKIYYVPGLQKSWTRNEAFIVVQRQQSLMEISRQFVFSRVKCFVFKISGEEA